MFSKTLLIGSEGYIGSLVKAKLSSVECIDIGWFGISDADKMDYKDLTRNYLKNYDNIILLAGHSSVAQCKNNWYDTYRNNIRNFSELLNNIEGQKLIYASSSSVYTDTKGIQNEDCNEFNASLEYDISKYTIDMIAKTSKKNYYGLRFGTVNGWSPKMRWDVMMNKMYKDAMETGKITVFNKQLRRPVASVSDIARAIATIIKSSDRPGLYNICNFNGTVEEYSTSVQKFLSEKNINIEIVDNGTSPAYDFAIDNNKFKQTFDFEYVDNIYSVLNSIYENHIGEFNGDRNKIPFYG